MTYGYQQGYNQNQGYGNQQQHFGQQQYANPQYANPQPQNIGYGQAPQQAPMRTIAPQGTQHLLPIIDAELERIMNEWLSTGTPQRQAFARVALAYSKINPKFNGLVFDIAEWLDLLARRTGQYPDSMVADKTRHFATLAACESTLKHGMTQGLDQNALQLLHRSVGEYNAIIAELDQNYNHNSPPMNVYAGQQPYQGVSIGQAMGTMTHTPQQQLIVNPNPAYANQGGYSNPNPYANQGGYINQPQVQPGNINQYLPPVQSQVSGGRYLDEGNLVVDLSTPVVTTPVQQVKEAPMQTYNEPPVQQQSIPQPIQYQDDTNGGVANFIDEITISPTQVDYTNHTEVRDNTRMQATNRLALNLQINRHPVIPRRKVISTAFNVHTTVALLEQASDGVWDEMFAGNDTESAAKLKLRGINVDYVDFETEKLIQPLTQLDVDRVADPVLAFKTMDSVVVSKSVDELLKDMENEAGVADGELIDLPEAVRLNKALAVMEGSDVYTDVVIAMADMGIDIGSAVHPVAAPIVQILPFTSENIDWIESIRNATSSNDVVRLLDEAREWMGEYHWNKLHRRLTDNTNYLLKTEFGAKYAIDSYALDTVDMYKDVKETCTDAEIALFKRIGKRVIEMSFNSFTKEQLDSLCGAEHHTTQPGHFVIGQYVPTVILPVYGADLGIAFAGDLGTVTKARMPQLFDLIQNELSKVDHTIPVYQMTIITKDAHQINVYMTLDGERVIVR